MAKLADLQDHLPETIKTLIAQTQQHQSLRDQLRELLPPLTRDALSYCMIHQQQLLLFVTNSAMLNRLRLHQYQLLQTVQATHPQVTEIHYTLSQQENNTPTSVHPAPRHRSPNADANSIEQLNALAEKITDQPLSDSLKHLAQVLSKRS